MLLVAHYTSSYDWEGSLEPRPSPRLQDTYNLGQEGLGSRLLGGYQCTSVINGGCAYVLGGCTYEWNIKTPRNKPTPLLRSHLASSPWVYYQDCGTTAVVLFGGTYVNCDTQCLKSFCSTCFYSSQLIQDSIAQPIITKIRSTYTSNPEFDPAKIRNASTAAEGLCKWVVAIEKYERYVMFM